LADDLQVKPGLVIPGDELSFSAVRSSGPGGQNVNKVASKVVLRFGLAASAALSEGQKARLLKKIPPRYLTKAGEVVIASEESRDQPRNRELCCEKLATVLREGLARPKTRRPTKPSRASRQRRLDEKKRHGAKKRGRKELD
jgi:ribosome-associated protein